MESNPQFWPTSGGVSVDITEYQESGCILQNKFYQSFLVEREEVEPTEACNSPGLRIIGRERLEGCGHRSSQPPPFVAANT